MTTPVGQDWGRLPPLEVSRQILAIIFDVDLLQIEEPFVSALGRRLVSETWPVDAPRRASAHIHVFPWLTDLFRDRGKLRIKPYDDLAEDLARDPDFRRYVRNAAWNWLRKNDEYTPRDITLAFAFEGHACAVDHAENWYGQRPNLTGRWHATWITLLEATLGRKPIIRLVKTETGRRRTEGELRKGVRQPGYPGDPVTDLAGGDDLDGQDPNTEDPCEILIRKEQVEPLKAAIQSLPPELREVFILRYYQGLLFREIGSALGVSTDTARRRFEAALTQLHKTLNPPPTEDRP